MASKPTVSDTDGAETLDDFDSAFDEAIAPESAPAGDEDQGPDDLDDDEASPEDDTSGSEKPAAADAPAGKQSSDDPWKDAPPHLIAERDRLIAEREHEKKSLTGRLSFQDRELARLRQQQSTPGAADKSAEQADKTVSDETITKLRDEYGEVAGPLLDLIENLSAKLDKVQQPVTQMVEQQAQSAIDAQTQLLNSTVPDWLDLAKHEQFMGWVNDQPRAVQEAVQRNWDKIEDGKEASWVFSQFKQSLGAEQAPAGQQQEDPKPSKTDQKRQRQLDAQRDGGTSGGAPVASGEPDDFDAAVDANLSRRERQRSAR